MAVFENCSVVLDLKNVPYKEKNRLMSAIVDNGGNIDYVVTQKCSFVVTSSLENLSSNRQRSVQKHRIPVVGIQFVWSCLEKGLLLPMTEHVLTPQPSNISQLMLPPPALFKDQPQPQNTGVHREIQKKGMHLDKCRSYKEGDHDIPEFPSHFQVAKYSIFHKAVAKTWSSVELQSARGEQGLQYRVVNSVLREAEETAVKDKLMFSSSSEEAVEVYLRLREELLAKGFTQKQTLPPEAQKLASPGLQQLLLEEQLNCSSVSQEVGAFVELIWTEALGSLNSILTVPVTSISLNDVSRVEGLLLQVQKRQAEEEVKALLEEVKTLLPLRINEPNSTQKLVSQKLDLCQLIRDILYMTEATLGNPSPSSLGKYRALRCSIEQVPSQSTEFQSVCQLLQDRPVQVQQMLRVRRGAELHMFKEELGNIKPLLHSSRTSSFMGILSRGLLLPRVGVEQHGIERTDIGNLGSGIYFSDSLSTSVKYSKPSVTDGSRLLLVCEVALGQCKALHRRDTTLTCASEGYNSVHGVRRSNKTHSDFEDDEYVVYNTEQVRLKYVVQYTLDEDQMKPFQPHIDTSEQLIPPLTTSDLLSTDESLEVMKNPLEEVTAGLLDSSGQTLPLEAVHVKCKLMDLLCQVIIFQTYTNKSSVPIEAKYVFPLEDTATVCGFEAFINGKHVIGKVKEKEKARKEYKQAIEKGHGAYLMDQDAPDVFTISVGNLPPGATVLIKVIFITELVVRAGSILFSLPGSVAPWQQSAALNQRTQTSVQKVCVNELQSEGVFSLCMSIEMPYEIKDLECSHLIQIKKTDCKAVISTLPEQSLSTEGFQLSFTLSEIHMPRMWVEKHPEKDTEACMLVFYPDFESGDVSAENDVVVLLDTSESMRGEAMLNARRIALKVLHSLDQSLRVNIISFGTDYREAFPSPKVLQEVFEPAKKFIMSSAPVGGSTELWRPLRSLYLLPPSHGVRNVLLLTDGHIQNQPQTLQLVRENAQHTRIFTCGLSPTANRHMLRALAQAGRGAYEFFDTKTKHTWTEKVKSQVKCMASSCCSSVAVKWQQFNPSAPAPVQAPSHLHALFSERHTLVYGFVPHCTQATLFGDLSGYEMKKVVSTTELQKTKGTFLHKLTARAIIRDYEDGSLGSNEAEHEGKKAELKSYIIELSKEFSILSQFTSFVAIEERDQEQPDSGFTDIPKIIAEEDVDILPYMGWTEEESDSDSEEIADEVYGRSNYRSYGVCHYIGGYSPDMLDNTSVEMEMSSSRTSEVQELSEDCHFREQTDAEDGLRRDFIRLPLVTHGSSDEECELRSGLARYESMKKSALKQDTLLSSRRIAKRVQESVERSSARELRFNVALPSSSSSSTSSSPDLSFKLVSDSTPHPLSHMSDALFYSAPPSSLEPLVTVCPAPPPPAPRPGPQSASLKLDSQSPGRYFPPPSTPTLFGASKPSGFSGPPGPPAMQHGPPRFGFAPMKALASDTAKSIGLPSPPPPPALGFGQSGPVFSSQYGPPAMQHGPPAFDLATYSASDMSVQPAPLPRPPQFQRPLLATQCLTTPLSGIPSSLRFAYDSPPLPSGSATGFSFSAAALSDKSAPCHVPAFKHPIASKIWAQAHTTQSSPMPPDTQALPPVVSASAAYKSSFICLAPAYLPQTPPAPIPAFSTVSADAAPFHLPRDSADSSATAQETRDADVACGYSERLSGSRTDVRRRRPVLRFCEAPTEEETRDADVACGFMDYNSEHLSGSQGKVRRRRRALRLEVQTDGVSKHHRQPDKINWEELFDLQHQEGYWECTGSLSRFLGLDVDFFANVFLKERGICSLGVKAHADILRLVATLLVLQLMRVMKMVEGELFQSLFRLIDSPEPRPVRYESVKRAVDWVCWADRQYPCVCSRLEFGWDWESCTRQLLGLDSLPPCSPLTSVLQRSSQIAVI